jgi:hypothetical protein
LSTSAEWLTALGTVAAAIGTIAAVLIVLFGPLFKKPKLSISLQCHEGTSNAYWHESKHSPGSPGAIANSVLMKQLRIWVANNGRKEAKNCRVKLRIIEPDLNGKDSPMEFTLPAFLYYRPRLSDGSGFLVPPDPEMVSADVSAHAREAFELLQHREGYTHCDPYSLTTFPLKVNKRYLLKLRAYADDASPSKEEEYRFLWDGQEAHLLEAVLPQGKPFPSQTTAN